LNTATESSVNTNSCRINEEIKKEDIIEEPVIKKDTLDDEKRDELIKTQ
jgi:hypothetical protein